MGVSGFQASTNAAADARDEHAALAESFERLYRREFRGIVGLAYALTGNRHAAEDLAQDTFVAAHRRWDEISDYDDPVAWLRRVVSNMSASLVRRRIAEAKALTRLAVRRSSPLPALDAETAEYWRAVRALPRRQAQTVALYYLFDLSVADVARTLEISEGTVKAHLHKARAALAIALEEPSEETL